MDARRLLATGDGAGALEMLKSEVRKAPRDAGLRTFLFQMFCVFGQWERALTQLTVAAELDPRAVLMAETYRTLIRCELVREGVFAGSRAPLVFDRPLDWIPLLLQANRALAQGAASAAASLRDQAFEMAESAPGTLDGAPFEWVADADPRLGPVLEAMLDGAYYWIPLQHVRELRIEPPADLRDQVWLPVEFTWINGGTAVGFVPSRYPGSATAADPLLALARRTEWVERDGWALGLGQRMLTTEADDKALLDIRRLTLDHPAAAQDSAALGSAAG